MAMRNNKLKGNTLNLILTIGTDLNRYQEKLLRKPRGQSYLLRLDMAVIGFSNLEDLTLLIIGKFRL